jgi:Bacterial trigger factor protein (TF)
MKLSVLSIAALMLTENVTAFAPCRTPAPRGVALYAVELTPEPEGGEELTAVKTMPGSRMKNMGEANGVTSDQGTVYSFWMQATANGALIKDLNTQVLKDAKRKANFPGFRKGQVPPFAMRTFICFFRWQSCVVFPRALLTCR